MGLVRRRLLVGLGFAVLSTAGLPAFAVEATLVADAHVNIARPTANSGGISNLNVGGGYTALLQFDLSTLPAGRLRHRFRGRRCGCIAIARIRRGR